MAGLILVNLDSGVSDSPLEELRERCPDDAVETCAPQELADRVRAAVADGVDFLGVAGGDGTIRCAVEALLSSSVSTPLLPVPAGTRNHFARDVGVETREDAARAASDQGRRRQIDVGKVNGRCFVNNSSIGVYPAIVVRRELHQRRMRKPVANVVAAWEQVRRGRRFWVEVADERHRVWMVFVGNGAYGEGLLDLADRETLDDNLLDVRVARADRPLARVRVVGALVLGRLARSPLLQRHRRQAITIDLGRHRIDVALDGEVLPLETPLRYESVAGGLTVLVPRNIAER